MDKIQVEDCQKIGNLDFIDWDYFKNSTILITGSTGLIGSNLVNILAYNSEKKNLNIKLILPVRNPQKAKKLFTWKCIDIIQYDIEKEIFIEKYVDYIVHLASPTNSKIFTDKPVDTMLANIEGIRVLLDWAKTNPVKKFVSLSTMEVYGFPEKGHKVKENELGAFETMNSRNSYPVSKIACEALCNSYFVQYDVPTVILRATQTFGPGVDYNDGRVFAEFMRCAIENKNIVLKTNGATERPYLYTADAVSAILVSLLKAEAGQAYTVANPETYCSIKDMAETVVNDICNEQINVIFEIHKDIEKFGYANTLFMDLDVSKIKKLDWIPIYNLHDMFQRMIESVKLSKELNNG